MSDDKFSETREMVIRQQTQIEALAAGQARIEAKLDKICEDNEDQHRQAREMITHGLGRVHERLNVMIVGGFGAAIGVIAYLLVYGAPWVTKEQYKDDIGSIIQEIRK